MIKTDSNAVQQQVKEISAVKGSSGRNFGPCTPASVLSFLYNRAEKFDADELEFLSRASGAARFMADQLATSISNIGCLIDHDSSREPGQIRAGNFEDGFSVGQLLFTIADQVGVISELVNIGSESEFALRMMGAKNV